MVAAERQVVGVDPGGVPGAGTRSEAAADRSAPRMRLRVRPASHTALVRRGVQATLWSDEPITGRLLLQARGRRTLARAPVGLEAGCHELRLRPTGS